MALYVTRFRYRNINGMPRPIRTCSMAGDRNEETLQALALYPSVPTSVKTVNDILLVELDWYGRQCMLAIGAYPFNAAAESVRIDAGTG